MSPGSCEGTRLASDEGDSLLSGHQEPDCEIDCEIDGDIEGDGNNINSTQMTLVLADCCRDKLANNYDHVADDDGFHDENDIQQQTQQPHHIILVAPNGWIFFIIYNK